MRRLLSRDEMRDKDFAANKVRRVNRERFYFAGEEVGEDRVQLVREVFEENKEDVKSVTPTC